jgi:hypothetical protein
MCEIRILNNEEFEKHKNNIKKDHSVIKDDNLIIKVYFDKRFKLIKENDNHYIFNVEPKKRAYFYNTITKIKINIKKSDKFIFIGDNLNIEIEKFIKNKKNDTFLVSKTITNKIYKYIE